MLLIRWGILHDEPSTLRVSPLHRRAQTRRGGPIRLAAAVIDENDSVPDMRLQALPKGERSRSSMYGQQ